MNDRRGLVVVVLLVLLGGSIPGFALLLSGGSPLAGLQTGSEETGEAGHGLPDGFHSNSELQREVAPSIKLLEALASVNLTRTDPSSIASALEGMQRSSATPQSPMDVLQAVDETLGDGNATRPASSPSLEAALDRYADARGLEPLTDDERAKVASMPKPLRSALIPAIDALAHATREHERALADLSPDQRHEIVTMAGRVMPGADAPDANATRKFHSLTEQIDVPRLLSAAHVLAAGVLETRHRLSDVLDDEGDGGIDAPEGGDAERAQALLERGVEVRDSRDAVGLAASTLRDQSRGTPGGAMAPSENLDEAIGKVLDARLPGVRLSGQVQGQEHFERLPEELQKTTIDLLDAYARLGSSSEQAAGVLDAVAGNLANLELWSYVLSSTPPDLHFRTADQVRDRHAGLAVAGPAHAQSLSGALRLAAYQGGHPTPDVDLQDPPPLTEALRDWSRAFDVQRSAQDSERVREQARQLPGHVAEALAVVLTAQTRAAHMLDDLQVEPEREMEIRRAAATVNELLDGSTPGPSDLQALETFQSFSTKASHTGLKLGLLLAAATDRANQVLEDGGDGPNSPDDEEEVRRQVRQTAPRDHPTSPTSPETDAPGTPTTGASPEGPLADPDRDVWFEGSEGLILVTGEGETTYPKRSLAVALDLGGNDVRPGPAGGARDTDRVPFSVSLDMGGDDRYVTDQPFAHGAAVKRTPNPDIPVGILADYGGDDVYKAGALSQGASLAGGIGMLYDVGGDDEYNVTGQTPRSPADFPIAGGQGYAVHAPGDVEELYPPAIGLHADAIGDDTYFAENGQGAAIALGSPSMLTTGVRSASGILLDTEGSDSYACEEICLGKGRFGVPAGIECGGKGGECAGSPWRTDVGADDRVARNRPGNLVSTGTFVDTDGHDDYRGRELNNRVGPTTASEHPFATLNFLGVPEAGFRVNASARVDVSLGDANRDYAPDALASWMGYDPEDEDEGPVKSPYERVAPVALLAGPDRDGDGVSDELEWRVGTDPGDAGSRPVAPPTAATGNGADKLIDIRLDLTVGSTLTGDGLPSRGPVGVVGVYPDSIASPQIHTDQAWSGHGTGTDGASIPLLAIGDSVRTHWQRNYPLTIDLGGPDVYANNAGSAFRPDGGTERSESSRPGAIPPLPGVAVDVGGNDVYTAADHNQSQGTGAFEKMGVVVDVLGDDSYSAARAAQGAGIGPEAVGVLVDTLGSDVYEIDRAGQGFTAPSCKQARSLVGDTECNDVSNSQSDSVADGTIVPSMDRESSRAVMSKSRTQAILLDAGGDDRYEGDGQGILEPQSLPDSGRCYGCPGEQGEPTRDREIPHAGSYKSPPSDTALPAPLDRQFDPTGDASTFADLNGSDTYVVKGLRDPSASQGYARGDGVPGQGSAVFVDAQGVDSYLQLPTQAGKTGRSHDKNNHVLINGEPGTSDGSRLASLFVDANAAPGGIDEDGDLTPDLAESLLGTRSIENDTYDPTDRNPVNEDADRIDEVVDLSRTVDVGTVLTIPRLDLLVAGTVDNVHRESKALLVDLGGDDRYLAPVGSGVGDPYDPSDTAADVGVGLDLSGSDEYHRHVEDPGDPTEKVFTGATQGSGVLGIGLHVDPLGLDEYNVSIHSEFSSGAPSLGLSQGAAYQGVGILIASDGSRFLVNLTTSAPPDQAPPSLGLSQGASWGGLGLLFAESTSRTSLYNVTVEPRGQPRAGAQGFAVEGAGLLVDTDAVSLVDPDTVTNIFEATGAAQGSARPVALQENPILFRSGEQTDPEGGSTTTTSRTGGLGLLLGGRGSDHYRSPTLSQGASLGRSWIGAVVDPAGDDTYVSEPLADQGLPALSQGVGVLGGVGALVDQAGRDRYHAGSNAEGRTFAQGSAFAADRLADTVNAGLAIHNCISTSCVRIPSQTQGLLADLGGSDVYTANGTAVMGSGISILPDNPGSTSLGRAMLYDVTGDDRYEAPDAPAVVNGPTVDETGVGGDGGGTGGSDDGLEGDCRSALGTDDLYFACDELAGLITDGPSGASVELTVAAVGLFLDSAGSDAYAPLPHPNAQAINDHVDCVDPDACPPRDGAGNNEIWSNDTSTADRARASTNVGVGVDAPSKSLALRAATAALRSAAGVSPVDAANVTMDVVVYQDPTCQTPVGGDKIADGTLCVQLRIEEAPETLAGGVESVRFLAVDDGPNGSRGQPAVIASLPGGAGYEDDGDRVYTVPEWNTSLPEIIDGDKRVRARVAFSTLLEARPVTASTETEITVDNPPSLLVEAPRWYSPSVGDALNVTLRAVGETGTVQGDASLPCAGFNRELEGKSVEEENATPSQGVSWHLSIPHKNVTDCPQTVSVNATVTDETNRTTPRPEPHAIGLDDRGPRVRIDVPEYVNRSVGSSGGFPVSWNVTDRGPVRDVDVSVRRGDRQGAWLTDVSPKGTGIWEGFDDGDQITFTVFARDAAGNLAPNSASTSVDVTRPIIQNPAVSPQYVGSGDPIVFEVNATDDQGLDTVEVEIDGERFQLDPETRSRGTTTWTFDGWSEVTETLAEKLGENASRPEGYPFRFLARDRAGNTATTVERQAFIDDVDPEIQGTTIRYPSGTAAGPGDLLQLVVNASDNLELGDTLRADVHNVSASDTVLLHRNPATLNYTGTFVANDLPDPENATVRVLADDAAGNQVRREVRVRLATEAPSIDRLRVVDRSNTSASLAWETNVPSTARVLVVNARTDEGRALTMNETTGEHLLTLDGLSPSTPYEVTIVPLNAAGNGGDERFISFTTRTAIDLDVTTPDEGTTHAGTMPVKIQAADPSGEPIDVTLRVVSQREIAPIERDLARFTVQDDEPDERTVDVTGVPDGSYRLVATASRGHDETSTTVSNLTIDNTAPFIRLTSPEPGSVLGPGEHEVRAAVIDRLSGVDASSVAISLDGETVPAELTGEGLFEATVSVTGNESRTIEVVAGDRAGNIARETAPVFVREEVPAAGSATLVLPEGQRAVKPGDLVGVRLRTPGASSLEPELAPADLTEGRVVPLAPDAGGYQGGFEVPADAREGLHVLHVRLGPEDTGTDRIPLELSVDETPPRVTGTEVLQRGQTDARLRACANTPVRASAVATADDAPASRSEVGQPSPCHVLRITELRPGTSYEVNLTLLDGAGNPTTSALSLDTLPDQRSPTSVSQTEATVPAEGIVRLTWDRASDDSGIEGYEILREGPDGERREIATARAPHYTDRNLTAAGSYEYTIRPVDLGGNRGPTSLARASVEQAPQLQDGSVTPRKGTGTETFTFTVNYTGPLEEDTRVLVEIDGVHHEMKPQGDPDACTDACTFAYETQLPAETLRNGGHEFRFVATSGAFTVQTPQDGAERGPVVTAQSSAFPAGQVAAVGGALAGVATLAAAALFVLRRMGGGGL